MSNQALKKLALSILTTALMVAFVGAFTQKTSKKDSPPSVKLQDVLERTAKNSVRLKDTSDFVLLKEADGKIAVQQKSTKKIIGKVGCGVCSGGKCTGEVNGNAGGCSGCGKSPNTDCTFDPF